MTEAFSSNAWVESEVGRLLRLHGTVEYFLFDEPIWYAGQEDDIHGCARSVEQIALAATARVMYLKKMFPAARIGDIEPSDVQAHAIEDFAADIKRRTGATLDVVNADVDWKRKSWPADLAAWTLLLSKRGINVGVILDGGAWSGGDFKWEKMAIQRFFEIRAAKIDNLHTFVYQSWMAYPHKISPETEFGTSSNLVMKTLVSKATCNERRCN